MARRRKDAHARLGTCCSLSIHKGKNQKVKKNLRRVSKIKKKQRNWAVLTQHSRVFEAELAWMSMGSTWWTGQGGWVAHVKREQNQPDYKRGKGKNNDPLPVWVPEFYSEGSHPPLTKPEHM